MAFGANLSSRAWWPANRTSRHEIEVQLLHQSPERCSAVALHGYGGVRDSLTEAIGRDDASLVDQLTRCSGAVVGFAGERQQGDVG